MNRPLHSVLLALVILGLGAGFVLGAGMPVAAGGAQPPGSGPQPQETSAGPVLFQPVELGPNTTRVLELDTVDASGTGSGSVSVTNALQAETGAIEATIDQYAVEDRLADQSTDRERVLAAAIDRTEARIANLAQRERAARDRFRTGEIGPDEYLSTVGEVNREARALETPLAAYEDLVDGYPDLQDRLAAQQTETIRYTGPVADEAGTAVTGGGGTGEIFVSVSDNGMMLSAIRDGTYIREIMRTDARDEAVGGVDLDAAQTRIAELYPWAWEHKGDVSINFGQDVFHFQLSHGHGVLNSLLDTSSGNVYREVQTKSLSNLPVVEGRSTTVDNATLQVSNPKAGAPVRIQVVNETGAPLPATVTADGTALGNTDDGPVWVLASADPFNVTAQTGDVSLELTVNPE